LRLYVRKISAKSAVKKKRPIGTKLMIKNGFVTVLNMG